MSAFIVNKTHLDYLISAGLMFSRQGHGPLRWLAPAEEAPAEATHERGEPWGPGAIEEYNKRRRELTPETADRVGAITSGAAPRW